MPMKDESSDTRGAPDPISAAAQGLAQAMAEAQRAIAAAQSQQSNASSALVQSQRECKMLKARNTELSELSSKLFSDVRAQSQTIEALRSRSDELATERDIHRQHAQAREGRITMLQQRIAAVESSRMKERLFREKERGELEALREEAKAGKAALKTERARLTREQNKFVQDKRTARKMLAGVKDSVDALNAQFAVDRSMDGSEDEDEKEPAASPRKRRKMDSAAQYQEAPREYPRRGRRAPNHV
ncbi:hypothetical protein C8F04DRAFT_1233153 [Mycena alexandri]|uniref:Uncharacterized protein n=1 Tax=Mycena alexandri TaxID=1745969 RepID=A0AAD6SYY2_9AGAR|nr:hypothetical protein C8F04DRAFT_1233153 [Mycena alexandri]